MIDIFIVRLIDSVYYWLCYQWSVVCSKHYFAEMDIRLPISEYTERKGKFRSILYEHEYTDFIQKTKPKACDCYMESVKGDKVFMEFKMVRENTDEKQERERYYDDLLRLAYESTKGNLCYFVVFGKKDDFLPHFMSPKCKPISSEFITSKAKVNSVHPYFQWFSFKPGKDNSKVIDTRQFKNYHGRFWTRHLNTEINNYNVTTSLISLKGISSKQKDKNIRIGNMCVGIWKVTAELIN